MDSRRIVVESFPVTCNSDAPKKLRRGTKTVPGSRNWRSLCSCHNSHSSDGPRIRVLKKTTPHSKDLALAYRALPAADLPPMATNPVTPRALRACFTALAHTLTLLLWYLFLESAERALETTLPFLFRMSFSLVMPDCVFSLLPLNTTDRALRPLATTLTRFAFITFFIVAFMALLADFMVVAVFFMGKAIVENKEEEERTEQAGSRSEVLEGP